MNVNLEGWMVGLICTYAVASIAGLISLRVTIALLLRRVDELEASAKVRDAGMNALAAAVQRLENRSIRIETILEERHKEAMA